MKVAIVGSRSITNCKEIIEESLRGMEVTEIVSGGAKGVDTVAKRYAKDNNIKYKEFLPDYREHGDYAPLKRNDEIVEYSDMVLAIWDGFSKGTRYTIQKALELRKVVIVKER